MNMNKKFLKYYMETEPEGTAKKYIFLVDNQDIAMNIVMSGYQALYLGQQEEEGCYSIDGFVGEMRSVQFQGSCQSPYHYVAACTVKWMNDRILEFCKDAARIEKGEVITWSKDKYNLFRQQVKDSFVADCAMTVLKALRIVSAQKSL